MGVSHLSHHAASAAKATAKNTAKNVAASNHGAISGFSNEALRAMAAPKAHPAGGARTGAKSGQPRLGKKASGVLNTVHVLPNGGRKG